MASGIVDIAGSLRAVTRDADCLWMQRAEELRRQR